MSFFRQNKERIIVALVTIILISIMAKTSVGRKSISKLEKLTGNSLSPIFKSFSKAGKKVNSGIRDIGETFSLREKNKELIKKVAILEEENRDYENLIGKSDFLKKHYDLLKTTNYNLIEAEVIGREPANWFNGFTIDKGSKDGIKSGDIVVKAVELDQSNVIEGLVGRVTEVSDNWSKVITIVDESSSISFKITRTQAGGVVSGKLDKNLEGYLFDDSSDVIKGDRIYTSGLGGKFVKDLYIGSIDEVINESEDMVKSIRVKPAINFKNIYSVYVLGR